MIRNNGISVAVCLLGLIGVACPAVASTDSSVIDLLPGFDRSRIAGVMGDEGGGEMAKLLYRVDRIADTARPATGVTGPLPGGEPGVTPEVGDWVRFDGRVESRRRIWVPEPINELLEFDTIESIKIRADGVTTLVYAVSADDGIRPGDRVRGGGVWVRSETPVIAAGGVAWTPRTIRDPGHQTLANNGIDLSVLAGLRSRDRGPLASADNAVFYDFLNAAEVSRPPPDLAETPTINLLRDSRDWIGRWVRLRVELSGVTRVAVRRRESQKRGSEQIGSDASDVIDGYYQWDAVARLDGGDVVIKTDNGDLEFSGRYPVSLVSVQPPPASWMTGGARPGDVFAPLDKTVDVDGLFFRCWAYDSELTAGTSKTQFGPLIMVASMRPIASAAADPVGVKRLGPVAAVAVVTSLLGVLAWTWVTRRGDRRARRSLPERLG